MRASTCALVVVALGLAGSAGTPTSARQPEAPSLDGVLQTYCVSCHNQKLRTAGVVFDTADLAPPAANPELWERVIAKLRARSMPPAGRPRPDAATYQALAARLESEIDLAWTSHPKAVKIGAVHRLNRTEYNNAIRDLFALDPASIDVKPLLPGDETADGSFDNFA